MEENGISQAVISDLGDGWKAFPDKATLLTANRRLRHAAETSGGRLAYLVYINPQLPDWKDIFDEFIDSACGVKLWISLRSEEYGFERTKDVLRAASEHNKSVLIHTFDRTEPATPGEIGIREIIELARSVPACRIVAAHAGGNWRRTIAVAQEIPENVSFDISGTCPERTMVQRLVSVFGSSRILYGSDAFGRSFASQLSKVFYSKLDDFQLEEILFKNCMRLFGLTAAAPVPAGKKQAWRIPDAEVDNFCFAGKSKYFDHSVTVAQMVSEADKNGIATVYAASLEALTADDKISANLRFMQECKVYPSVRPLAAVDLKNMPEAMHQIGQLSGFAGVVISPYLHGYLLDYLEFSAFFDACCRMQIPLWINAALGDDRFRPADLSSRCVSSDEIISFISSAPVNRYIFQGCTELAKLSRLLPEYCKIECSKLSDWEYAPEEFFAGGNVERLCFGSEYPFRDAGEVACVLGGGIFFS